MNSKFELPSLALAMIALGTSATALASGNPNGIDLTNRRVTISGHIESGLVAQLDVEFLSADKSSCSGFFPYISCGPNQKEVDIAIRPDSNGYFSVTFSTYWDNQSIFGSEEFGLSDVFLNVGTSNDNLTENSVIFEFARPGVNGPVVEDLSKIVYDPSNAELDEGIVAYDQVGKAISGYVYIEDSNGASEVSLDIVKK